MTSAQPKSQSGSRTSNPRHSAVWRPACSGDARTRVRASDVENRAAFRASPRQPAGLFRPSSFAARGEWRRLSQLTSAHLGSISAPLGFTAVLWLCFLWALSVLKPAQRSSADEDGAPKAPPVDFFVPGFPWERPRLKPDIARPRRSEQDPKWQVALFSRGPPHLETMAGQTDKSSTPRCFGDDDGDGELTTNPPTPCLGKRPQTPKPKAPGRPWGQGAERSPWPTDGRTAEGATPRFFFVKSPQSQCRYKAPYKADPLPEKGAD